MNLKDIKYISQSTSSLSFGSFLEKEDLDFFTEGGSSINFPFGKTEKDFLEISVYDSQENYVTSSLYYSTGTRIPHTNSYYDVFNNPIQYSYSSYISDWVVVGNSTQSLFLDLGKQLRELNVSSGNYKVILELGRNIVGNEKTSKNKLIIDTISTSRTEISVIPKTSKGTDDQINQEFNLFSNGQILLKDVADDLIYGISKPEIYNIYNSAVIQNPNGSNSLMFYYGLKKDIDVISLLTDLYYGVKKGSVRSNGQISSNDILGIYDQFKNWTYQNYNSGTTFDAIRDYYYSLFVYIVDQELNRITNKKPDNYNEIVNFLKIIYYDSILYPSLENIETKYNTDLNGYFKYKVHLSNGDVVSVLNRKVSLSSDDRFYDKLVLKLDAPLSDNIKVGSDIWITNDFAFLPIVQNVYFFTPRIIRTIPIKGPNFFVKIENSGNSTDYLSMDDLVSGSDAEGGLLYNSIISGSYGYSAAADYREFANFINFSSANLRVNAYGLKKSRIDELETAIQDIDSKLIVNPADKFYIQEKSDFQNEVNSLKIGFDGYESFLYNNPMWYKKHSEVVDGYSSASLYDKQNDNSLINNLPQFLLEDSEQNQDYIKFVSMIGHFFDNISLSVKQFTEKNNFSSAPSRGISMNMVGDMLRSLGWETEISKDNLDLILSSFSKSNFDFGSDFHKKSNQLSEETRNQVIWKRILNSLPLIYKTKGTESSLNALLSCFGIPKNIIKIKEYGGIQNSTTLEDKSLYIVDEVKYEPYFSGSGEYFQLNWTGSVQSLEFNLRFDPTKTSEEGKVFRLVNASDNWVLGAYRDRGNDWGKLFFSIGDGVGNTKTTMTSRIPIFDGNSYHVMLRKNDIDPLFGATQSFDYYPTKYDLMVEKNEDERITFFATSSIFLSGSYNESFKSGSYLFIGNYNQNISSLSIDPEAFFGNIDDINLWESPITNARFTSHTLNRRSYDLESPQKMISENLYRISFERPLDLHTSSISLNNLSFRNDFPTFLAIDFPIGSNYEIIPIDCVDTEVPTFPYQFTRKDVRLTMHLPDYGGNKFRSNRINYFEQSLVSNLSSETRVSVRSSEMSTIDSNKIGIFFSPADIQNSEIIKFFGDYPLGDLIGDPASVYDNTYSKFEKFKKIYYDQGFGNIDYQFFMNIVRFYFDKAMFNYIKSIVPARAKLVDGILIEPSILERPKIQLKPVKQEAIKQQVGSADMNSGIVSSMLPRLTSSLFVENKGTAIYSDVNQIFYPADEDEYGFSIYSENGVTFYQGKYYRVDKIKNKKSYQVYRDQVLPKSSLNDYEISVDSGGTLQTVSRSYQKINLAKLPDIKEYGITSSFGSVGKFYFSGSTSFNSGISGYGTFAASTTHTINGLITGSILGTLGPVSPTNWKSSDIKYNGLYMSSTYQPIYYPSANVTYTGLFYNYGTSYGFVGTVTGQSLYSVYHTTFLSTGSLFDDFKSKTSGPLFGYSGPNIEYQKKVSMENYPYNATLMKGYSETHYKYKKMQFSSKEVNSYDQSNRSFKWRKGSQNKKTTVEPSTGLLDNSDPVVTKTI